MNNIDNLAKFVGRNWTILFLIVAAVIAFLFVLKPSSASRNPTVEVNNNFSPQINNTQQNNSQISPQQYSTNTSVAISQTVIKGIAVDPIDSYVNVRSEPNKESIVVCTINVDEEVQIIGQSANWFKVKTQREQTGFVHNSRIRIITD